jgi:hypothetical protein
MITLFYIVLFIAIIFLTCFSIARWVEKRDRKYYIRIERLKNNWKSARARRRGWLREHPYEVGPYNTHYSELWEAELGAEALLDMECGSENGVSSKEYEARFREIEGGEV